MIIKIRGKEYQMTETDSIFDNGACFQLFSGKDRDWGFDGWHPITSIVIPKSVMKNIDLTQFKVRRVVDQTGRVIGKKYYLKGESK